MVTTYSKTKDQPGEVANPAQLNREHMYVCMYVCMYSRHIKQE